MSGELELAVSGIYAVGKNIQQGIEKRRARRRRLKKAREELRRKEKELAESRQRLANSADRLNSEQEKLKAGLDRMETNIGEIEDDIKQLRAEDRNDLLRFKTNKIENINSLFEGLDDELKGELKDKRNKLIKTIENTDDKYDIIDSYVQFKVDCEDAIDRALAREEEKLADYNNFELGDNAEEDEELIALLAMYEELEKMGYNPVYIADEKKIIVSKDNGDQIVASSGTEKMKLEFHDYHGRDCIQDMSKIERELKSNGLLKQDERIYTNWYDKKEKEENKEIVSKTAKIYQKNKKSTLYNEQGR